jgi:hypothetical protein
VKPHAVPVDAAARRQLRFSAARPPNSHAAQENTISGLRRRIEKKLL